MKTLVTLIFCLNFIQPAALKIVGTIVHNNEGWPSCRIQVVGAEFKSVSNLDGEFALEIDTNQEFIDLKISPNVLSGTTVIKQIPTNYSNVKLTHIPIFLNKSIEEEEFKELSAEEQQEYEPIYHWITLLGYMHKNQIDISELSQIEHFLPTYDPKTNTVTLNYQNLIKQD